MLHSTSSDSKSISPDVTNLLWLSGLNCGTFIYLVLHSFLIGLAWCSHGTSISSSSSELLTFIFYKTWKSISCLFGVYCVYINLFLKLDISLRLLKWFLRILFLSFVLNRIPSSTVSVWRCVVGSYFVSRTSSSKLCWVSKGFLQAGPLTNKLTDLIALLCWVVTHTS